MEVARLARLCEGEHGKRGGSDVELSEGRRRGRSCASGTRTGARSQSPHWAARAVEGRGRDEDQRVVGAAARRPSETQLRRTAMPRAKDGAASTAELGEQGRGAHGASTYPERRAQRGQRGHGCTWVALREVTPRALRLSGRNRVAKHESRRLTHILWTETESQRFVPTVAGTDGQKTKSAVRGREQRVEREAAEASQTDLWQHPPNHVQRQGPAGARWGRHERDSHRVRDRTKGASRAYAPASMPAVSLFPRAGVPAPTRPIHSTTGSHRFANAHCRV